MLASHKLLNHTLLLMAALLLACKKDAATPTAAEVRLFTNKSEITDEAVKAKFLSQVRVAAAFQTPPTVSTGKITFVAPDTVTFGTSTIRFAVIKKAEQYLFYSPPVVQLFTAYDVLVNDMLKYGAPRIPVACGGNLSDCYVTQEVRVGYGYATQLRLSYLQYYWARPYYGWSRGLLFNELNEGIINKVAASDTLAVRVSLVSFPVQ